MRRLLVCLLAAAAMPAQALELELRGFYDLNRPASLDYDPTFCGLWIANEGPEVILVTLDGLELQRFRSGLSRIKAVAVEGNGLLVADGYGRYQRLSKSGDPLGDPFRLTGTFSDTEGIAVEPDGTLVMVEDDPARILWTDPNGHVLRELDTSRLDPPLTEPQGVARDPRNGHMLIVDDWEGSNSLFEFGADGALLGTTPLIAYGTDPEGIAIRPGSGTVFIAFDGGARIAAFDYVPTGGAASDPDTADCMISGLRSGPKPV
ncbi:MAG: hypothetical protein QNJ44_13935 [Rhodobacter sp.]|nr:hypothetical protein [Rhodobacter sp.]